MTLNYYFYRMHDELFMKRALDLASLGLGKVAPNPMVGAVIVHNGKIIGEGYHEKYGEAHAEVNAVANVQDSSLLKESTMYVTLEPCSHFGKTPPCADMIVRNEIKRVVVAQLDPHDKVAGRGIKIMQDAGVQVEIGVLEKEARFLNRRFNMFHEHRRPYVILKWAETCDGFMGRDKEDRDQPSWMTSIHAKNWVHHQRSHESAIVVGKHTAINDDPELTVRLVDGENPTRIVIDRKGEVSQTAKILSDEAPTLHITQEVIGDWDNLWNELGDLLFHRGIQSVIIEGGSITLQNAIAADFWDEAYKFVSPQKWVRGVQAPNLKGDWKKVDQFFDQDQLFYLKK